MTVIIVEPSHRADFELALKFDFDAAVVAAIKAVVPKRVRTYDPELRTWYVAERAAVLLEDVARASGAVLVYAADAPTMTAVIGDFATLHLLPTAPPSVVRAAWKALSKELHPDVGGDTAAMQMINGAYARLTGGG